MGKSHLIKQMGIKNIEESEKPYVFDPCLVRSWYPTEHDFSGNWDRTLIEFSDGCSASIGCTVKEFEFLFLRL